MNLSLADPFPQEFPDTKSTFLKYGHSTCLQFSSGGDYLASGLIDGRIVIFDFDTYGVLTVLTYGHTRAIQSLSWSNSNRYLLSASRDWKCIIWDLEQTPQTPFRTVNFETPIWSAWFNPVDERQFVASLLDDNAKFVDFRVLEKEEEKDSDKILHLKTEKDEKSTSQKDDPIEGQNRTPQLNGHSNKRKRCENGNQQESIFSKRPIIIDLESYVRSKPVKLAETPDTPQISVETPDTRETTVDPTETSKNNTETPPSPTSTTTKKSKKGKKGKQNSNTNNANKTSAAESQDQQILTCLFSSNGKYIITGTSKGFLNIIPAGSSHVIFSTRLSTSTIKSIKISNSGKFLVTNSVDRIIRFIKLPDMKYPPPKSQILVDYDDDENDEKIQTNLLEDYPEWNLEILHKFQDVVNRWQWNSILISPSSEYILASTYERTSDIYMWETSMGSLVKIYDGPKEDNVDVCWHPTLPVIMAAGLEAGIIDVWSLPPPQRWSALAPDFTEVEENVVYEEAEDEFDHMDQVVHTRPDLDGEQDVDVDVLNFHFMPENDGYIKPPFYIPVTLEVEEEEKSDSDND